LTRQTNFIYWVVMILASVWGLGAAWGIRLPYLHTNLSWQIRAYFLFPALVFIFVYAWFLRKRKHGASKYREYVNAFSTKRDKVKFSAWLIVGIFFLPGIMAWFSLAIPIWLARFTAVEPFERVYKITEVTSRGGTWYRFFDLELVDQASGDTATLPLVRAKYDEQHWQAGEVFCAKGRTSVFGTIISSLSKEIADCRAS
jgi:hypothetical protein